MILTYHEYLTKTNKEDNKDSWIDWKFKICRMPYMEAVRAANDPNWGYEC